MGASAASRLGGSESDQVGVSAPSGASTNDVSATMNRCSAKYCCWNRRRRWVHVQSGTTTPTTESPWRQPGCLEEGAPEPQVPATGWHGAEMSCGRWSRTRQPRISGGRAGDRGRSWPYSDRSQRPSEFVQGTPRGRNPVRGPTRRHGRGACVQSEQATSAMEQNRGVHKPRQGD